MNPQSTTASKGYRSLSHDILVTQKNYRKKLSWRGRQILRKRYIVCPEAETRESQVRPGVQDPAIPLHPLPPVRQRRSTRIQGNLQCRYRKMVLPRNGQTVNINTCSVPHTLLRTHYHFIWSIREMKLLLEIRTPRYCTANYRVTTIAN